MSMTVSSLRQSEPAFPRSSRAKYSHPRFSDGPRLTRWDGQGGTDEGEDQESFLSPRSDVEIEPVPFRGILKLLPILK